MMTISRPGGFKLLLFFVNQYTNLRNRNLFYIFYEHDSEVLLWQWNVKKEINFLLYYSLHEYSALQGIQQF
jgi:hypothetical protein